MNRPRIVRDSPRCIAALKAWLETKQLYVVNIDDVNVGLDCFYVSARLGVRTAVEGQVVEDRMWRAMGLQGEAPLFRDITNQQFRDTAADTINFILDSMDGAWAGMKEALTLHINTEGRTDQGPEGQNRVNADATFQAGEHDHM
jgi:integrase